MSDQLPFLTSNLGIVSRRWPALLEWLEKAPSQVDLEWRGQGDRRALAVNGQQLYSRFDPEREAVMQAGMIPEDASPAWVYGLGGGHLPRALLARPATAELHLVPLSRIVSLVVFGLFDQSDWLEDDRVRLQVPNASLLPRRPFAVVPPCLALADADCKVLADRLRLELNTPHLDRRHLEDPGVLANLRANEARLGQDGRVQDLADSAGGNPVWVAAAGPTLDQQLRRLAARPPAETLIAVDAALGPLVRAGVRPDLVVAVDGRPALRRFFAGDLSPLRGVPLVYFPVVMPDILDRWPGPRLAACGERALYAELRERFGLAPLFLAGSVLHSAVDLARLLGAASVRLAGVDLCYPGATSHAAGCAAAVPTASLGARDWVLDGHGRRVPSTPSLIGFLRDLELYIARHREIQFINLDRRGAQIEGTVYEDD
jgi:hypothetical protein